MWKIQFSPSERRLSIWLMAEVDMNQLDELASAQARALEATGGRPFTVFVDMRNLFPMDPDAVLLLAEIKRVALSTKTCEGMAILADSPTIAMQQHRTRQKKGSPKVELVTLDETEATRFLEKVGRPAD